jgi:Tfp pilus assembly protein PilF
MNRSATKPTVCAVCGAEFPSPKGFHRLPIGKGRFDLLCPGCTNRQAESVFDIATAFAILMVVIGTALFHRAGIAPALLFYGTLSLTLTLTILPHELGHALAALAVGMRLFTVTVGTDGRILCVRQVLGYDFVFHRILWGGHVLYTPKNLRLARLRNSVGIVGGPLAHGLLIGIALGLLEDCSGEDAWYCVLGGFVWGNILQLAISLFPRKVWIGDQHTPNDGLLLLTAPFMSGDSIRAWHSMTFYYEALESLQRGSVQAAEQWLAKGVEAYPDNSWAVLVQANILDHQHRYAEARELFLTAANQPEATTEERAYLWNSVAWLDLMIADPNLLEEADRFSRQALEEIPLSSHARGTRGSVLIELGRIDEGRPLVEQALREHERGPTKSANACYLAMAMARQGDLGKAREYIDEARRCDAHCPLLERAIKECEQAG